MRRFPLNSVVVTVVDSLLVTGTTIAAVDREAEVVGFPGESERVVAVVPVVDGDVVVATATVTGVALV